MDIHDAQQDSFQTKRMLFCHLLNSGWNGAGWGSHDTARRNIGVTLLIYKNKDTRKKTTDVLAIIKVKKFSAPKDTKM